MAQVSLKNVKKAFGAVNVIKGVDIEIANGEFVVFVGPSGCGKSTLLRMVAGLETISGGELRIGGALANNLTPKERGVAMVFQSYAIFPHMTVRENVAFGMKLNGVPKAERMRRADDAARILQMEHLMERKPSQLSGGQRQRVAIGRAIVRNPEVFLFDEPLSNLDASLRQAMRMEIGHLHKQLGATMIYVTHDQTEALTFADQVVVMQDGEVVQIGTPVDLFERPQHTFVGHFIGSPGMNVLKCELREGTALLDGNPVTLEGPINSGFGRFEIGIRPEFVSIAPEGLPAVIRKVSDIGRHNVVEAMVGDQRIAAVIDGPVPGQGDAVHLAFNAAQTRLYRDGWIATSPAKAA